MDDINKIIYPKTVENKEPVNTPILTPSIYWVFSTKAKLPTNKLNQWWGIRSIDFWKQNNTLGKCC